MLSGSPSRGSVSHPLESLRTHRARCAPDRRQPLWVVNGPPGPRRAQGPGTVQGALTTHDKLPGLARTTPSGPGSARTRSPGPRARREARPPGRRRGPAHPTRPHRVRRARIPPVPDRAHPLRPRRHDRLATHREPLDIEIDGDRSSRARPVPRPATSRAAPVVPHRMRPLERGPGRRADDDRCLV